MAVDAHKNFAYSTVLTAPSPASSGTSLVVQSGDGAKFPAASFNATIWPAGAQPTTANAEIVRVTVVSTDTFTITRAQESSSARTVVVGDQIAAGITVKTITDLEGYINGTTAPTFVTPALGTPASGTMTNVSGTAASLTAGNVTTNANLTGDVTSSGNATTIAAGKVTNAMLATAAGAPGGAWNTFTPTWTGLTVGNATNNGRYLQIGKTIYFEIELTIGSTTSYGGTFFANFPVTAVTYLQYHRLGFSQIMNAAAGVIYNGSLGWDTTARFIILNDVVSSVNVKSQGASSTVPISLTTGALIIGHGFYEAA